MQASAVFEHWVDWWIPPSLRTTFARLWRARLLVQIILVVLAALFPVCALYVARSAWVSLAVTVFTTAVLLATLFALKITGAYRACVIAPLVLAAGAMYADRLVEAPIDGAGLCWVAILPFAASVLLGRRAALWWGCAAFALILAIWFRPEGLVETAAVPTSLVLARALFLAAILVGLATVTAKLQAHATAEVERVERLKTAYLTTVSHELQQPLSGMLAITALVREAKDPSLDFDQLELLERSGREMTTLVGDLVDLSQLETGSLRLEPRTFELQAMLDACAAPWAEAASAKGLKLTVSRAPEVPTQVVGDDRRLARVLGHLLQNAVKFTERGAVSVSVELASPTKAEAGDTRLRFTVRDTGSGMAREQLRAPEGPLLQADTTKPRRREGAGMGLKLCRALLACMGSALELASTENAGTTAAFELELELERAPLRQQPPQHVE